MPLDDSSPGSVMFPAIFIKLLRVALCMSNKVNQLLRKSEPVFVRLYILRAGPSVEVSHSDEISPVFSIWRRVR